MTVKAEGGNDGEPQAAEGHLKWDWQGKNGHQRPYRAPSESRGKAPGGGLWASFLRRRWRLLWK